MEDINVSDAKTLIIKLNQLNNDESSIFGSNLWEILDTMHILFEDEDITEEEHGSEIKEFDILVKDSMKAINPECEDIYNGFLAYFTDESAKQNLIDKVRDRIDENWQNISKTLKECLEDFTDDFDDDIMQEVIVNIYIQEVENRSIGSIELLSLFDEEHISQDSSFIERVYYDYSARVEDENDDSEENEN